MRYLRLHLMNMFTSHRRTFLLFGALTVYILLQFTWWAVFLVRKENEVGAIGHGGEAARRPTGPPHERLTVRCRMIVGEGCVFLLFLLLVSVPHLPGDSA